MKKPEIEQLYTTLFFLFLVMLVVSLSGALVLAGGLVLATVVQALSRRALPPGAKRLGLLALLYVASFALIDGAQNGWAGIRTGGRHAWLPLVGVAAAAIAPSCRLDGLWRRWCYLHAFAAAVYLLQYIYYGYDPHEISRYGFHSSPYVSALLFVAPSLYLLGLQESTKSDFLIVVLFGVSIMALNSRGATVAWLVALLVLFLTSPGLNLTRSRKFWAIVAIVAIFAVGLPNRWRIDLSGQNSIVHRLVMWAEVLEQIRDDPWFGHGFQRIEPRPEMFAPEYRHYVENETNPHNSYLQVVHAVGLVGYAIFWFVHAGALWMVIRRNRLARHGSARLLPRVAAANLVGLFVAGIADQTFFAALPMLQAWFLIGTAIGSSEERSSA